MVFFSNLGAGVRLPETPVSAVGAFSSAALRRPFARSTMSDCP
jgi:hypothetical protein